MVEPITNIATTDSLESQLLSALHGMVEQGRWKAGERLPAERHLCEEFSVSRNTVRSALKKLEAEKIVTIKRGSGCYLNNAAEGIKESEPDTAPVLMDKLEAAYLFLPSVFANAVRVITAQQIADLEDCTGKIGRAILDSNWYQLRLKSEEFFSIVSGSLNNKIVQDVSCSICASSSYLFPRFSSFDEEDRNKMFADFVLVLKAIKARDVEQARMAIRAKITNVASALAKLRGIPVSPIIAADQLRPAPP